MRGPCIVYGCHNDGVHQLPKEQTMKTQWITAAKLDTKLKAGRRIKTYTYFCSDHFKDTEFYYSQPLFDGDKGNRILRKGSVPSIFPWTLAQAREAESAQVEATTSVQDSEDQVRFDPNLVINDYSKNNHRILFVEEIPFIEVNPNAETDDPLDLPDDEKHSETRTMHSSLQLDEIDDTIDDDTVAMKMEVTDSEHLTDDEKHSETRTMHFSLQLDEIDDTIDDDTVAMEMEVTDSEHLTDDEKHSETRTMHSSLQLDEIDDTIDDDTVAMEIEVTDSKPSIESYRPPNRDIKSYSDASVQTVNIAPVLSVYTYKNDDKAIHFYTGLETYKKMFFVFTTLGTDVHHLKYFHGLPPSSLDPLQQFFLVLTVLRRHKTFEELSMMYLISIKDVSNLVITWIRFMSLVWKKIDLWVGKETVKSYMPFDFNDKFPMTRVIIDATECPIKKPGSPRAQQITFSSYKNRNTVKFLLGITPSGLITYVSPSYGGSASDRQIIERSDILNRFDPHDEVMVDKGLNVQDIFVAYGVKINTFFKKGNQIGSETSKINHKVASKRIHIERTIRLLKTYKILVEPMNNTEIILSSDIVFICAILTNFRSNIVNKKVY